jgi:NADH dehydrogenase/NADH:ubiquinone oxidoreductase subunit G
VRKKGTTNPDKGCFGAQISYLEKRERTAQRKANAFVAWKKQQAIVKRKATIARKKAEVEAAAKAAALIESRKWWRRVIAWVKRLVGIDGAEV